jgi:glycosyltransferase involved in cell wall biosynthesis
MNVLFVNSDDNKGGAAKITQSLNAEIQAKGHLTSFLVGYKTQSDDNIIEIHNEIKRNPWARYWITKRRLYNSQGKLILPGIAFRLALFGELNRWLDHVKGIEDFNYPATKDILKKAPFFPEILHLHNLHGEYFDLEQLPKLSAATPTVITLHDTWLLSGHCGYFLDCQKWKTGCGSCPYLDIYPSIRRDATAFNWKRKETIYESSKFSIITPSEWMMKQVEKSMLSVSIWKKVVINNGIDLAIFKPGAKNQARHILELPLNHLIILFVGNRSKNSPYKNIQLIERAINLLASKHLDREILFIILGEETKNEFDQLNIPDTKTKIRLYPYQSDEEKLVNFYQASDVFVHAAKAENFPTVVLEAMACGLPVIATAVGGIPEQVVNEENGFLVSPNNELEMYSMLEQFLENPALKKQLGGAGVKRAQKYYSLEGMITKHIQFYEEILSSLG